MMHSKVTGHRVPTARTRLAIGAVLVVGLIAAACGGGSKKSQANGPTTSTSEDTTTTALAPGETTTTAAPGATTTTAVKTGTAAAKSTATTARRSGATTSTVPKGITKLNSGINNVNSSPTTAQPSDVQPGGTLVFAKTADIASMDPVKITNSGASDGIIAPPVYDMLMYNDVSSGTVVAQTAESLTSTDALNWTLKLRPNIKFTDGTPYDANAVKFNWERIADPANAATKAAQAQLIASMTATDPVTLQIVLKAKNAQFPVVVTFIPFIASPAAIQAQGASYGSNGNVVGAGPFVVKSWQRDTQWTMVRNPSYWEAPLPYVDQIIVKPIADETQRMNTFMAGQANMTFMGAGSNADQIDKSGKAVEHTMILNGGIGLEFNTQRAPFNDIRARQAVAMALDNVDYAKVVNGGLQDPITGLFRSDSPFYDKTLSYPWNQPAQAQQLIDQVAAANGGTFAFTITAFATTNYALSAQYVQAKLNKYNHVKVDIVTEAPALHITNCTQGTFANACGTGLIFDDPEPGWTGIYTCNSKPSPTGWCNPQFDKDVVDQRETLNAQQRVADIKDMQKIFYNEIPTLILERRYSWMFSTPDIQNFKYANDGIPLVYQIWIKSH